MQLFKITLRQRKAVDGDGKFIHISYVFKSFYENEEGDKIDCYRSVQDAEHITALDHSDIVLVEETTLEEVITIYGKDVCNLVANSKK